MSCSQSAALAGSVTGEYGVDLLHHLPPESDRFHQARTHDLYEDGLRPSEILNPGRGSGASAHIESTTCPCDTANRHESCSRRQARTAPQRGDYRPRVASSDRDPFSHRTGRHRPLGYVASGKPSRSAPIARLSHSVCTIPSGWQFLSGYGAGPPSGNGHAGDGLQPWGISERSAPRTGRAGGMHCPRAPPLPQGDISSSRTGFPKGRATARRVCLPSDRPVGALAGRVTSHRTRWALDHARDAPRSAVSWARAQVEPDGRLSSPRTQLSEDRTAIDSIGPQQYSAS